MSKFTSLIIASFLVTAGACGNKSSGGGKGNKVTSPIKEDLETVEGRYVAKLSPLNSAVSGFTTGQAKVTVMADEIAVTVEMKDAPARTSHAQYIYTASHCPVESDDANDDGFVDPQEASEILGKVLIPLDGNLNSQEEGLDEFPVANHLGNYKYYKEGLLSSLVTDLESQDLDEKDEMTKLVPGEKLKLDGKVIVIQGVSQDVYLPGSIRGIKGQTEYEGLTIACGKLERVKNPETETSASEE